MISRATHVATVLSSTAVLTLLMLSSACTGLAQESTPPITAAQRAALVDSVTQALMETYIFLETAEEMRGLLNAKLRDGEYDGLSSSGAFARRLTEDLQSVSHDLHLRVSVRRPPPTDQGAPLDPEERARLIREEQRRQNYFFRKVEILPNNIGYMRFDGFMDAGVAGPTAVAAMNFLANADALIIDLRYNGGGDPSMIQLINSYFFDEPTHLNSFYIRRTDEWEQYWTQAHVQGPRMTETPIYVLTSGRTFSAAEEFTYNLKHLERATIVGETTRGGAHPVTGRTFQLGEATIGVSIPFGRAVNPITGANWEGTGIEPHIRVSAEDALERAVEEASRAMGGGGR